MTTREREPPVSVAVLNHRRPHLLRRVLTAIRQLDYPDFEVVVVGDQPSIGDYGLPSALGALPRYVFYPKPNICRSRNIAVGHAAGKVVAFIDDDAVPEPNWLTELIRPFSSDRVGMVGGVVRARNGLDMEWAGGVFDLTGREHGFDHRGKMVVRTAAEQIESERYLAVRGVNSAFWRSAVTASGGFDESIRYYLDETDLAVRLVHAGWASAINPLAEVHHGLAENASRSRVRKPRNLFEISASMSYFLRRHLPAHRLDAAVDGFRKSRLADLDHHIRLGMVRGPERTELLRQLNRGIDEGLKRRALLPLSNAATIKQFRPVPARAAIEQLNIALVTGWGARNILSLARAAETLADHDHRVSRISYFSGTLPPWVIYHNGVWVHRGGTWRFDLKVRGERVMGRRRRAHAEIDRISWARRFDLVLSPFAADRDTSGTVVRIPNCRVPLFARPASGRRDAFDRAIFLLSSFCNVEVENKGHTLANIKPRIRTNALKNPVEN